MERQARYQYSDNKHTAQIVKTSKLVMKSVHTADYNKHTQRVDNDDKHMAKYPFAKKLKKWTMRYSCTYYVCHMQQTHITLNVQFWKYTVISSRW
jgi:hypothetical protein